MLRAWKLNLEFTLRGLKSFSYVCQCLIGKQNQYRTCPRHKFSKKHSEFSLLQCLDALLVKEAIFMYMYVCVYIHMCVCAVNIYLQRMTS